MFTVLKRISLIFLTSLFITSIIVSLFGKIETTNPLRPFANFWQVWQSEASEKQQAINNNQILSKEVTAYAQVGGYTLNRLSGWTSPYAEVQLNSVALTRKTLADEQGAFAFYNIPILPDLGELCLVSQDVNLLPSFPTCLAPPPTNQNIDIINVLLSPSLSIGSSIVHTNSTVTASGMTFPNSPVEVYLYSRNETVFYYLGQWFTNQKYNWPWKFFTNRLASANFQLNYHLQILSYWLKPIKTAQAFSLPKYQTNSNSDGYFEFSLPGPSSSYNRFYVASALNITTNNQPSQTRLSQTTGSNQQVAINNTTNNIQSTNNNKQQAVNNNIPDFLPKTNIAAEAAADETVDSTETWVSPKSNTLYFRSLGWLGSLFNQLFSLLTRFWAGINNLFGLVLIEMVIVLGLFLIFVYRWTARQ